MCILYVPTTSPGGMSELISLQTLLASMAQAHVIIVVILNFTTTVLIVFRVWSTQRASSKYSVLPSRLDPVWRILLESAMLQFIAEFLFMIMAHIDPAANFIFLQTIVPIIVSICSRLSAFRS